MIEVIFKVYFLSHIYLSYIKYFNNIIFQVEAHLKFGEEVRLSGNVPSLGCNNPDRAIPMYTTPSMFPIWSTKEGNKYYYI